MNVPLLDLAAQYHSVESDLRAAIERVLASRIYILGPEAEALERELAALCGARFGVGVSNGSDAILTSLMALGVGPGDEVIVPTFTFFATAGCVARTGARPVFVDILPETFNIDPDAAAAAVTPRTRAIIPVHLYGQCADMPRIKAIADRHGLAVVEDACQAVGATLDGHGLAHWGHCATLSFYPTKNLSAIGEAGMVLTNDEQLAETLRCIRNHGQGKQYEHHLVGGNFRIAAIQAAALRAKLPRLTEWNAARRRHAALYDRALAGSAVTPPAVDPRCAHVYHQYTIRCDRRDALRARLSEAGIGSGIYYPLPLHLQPCFAHLGGRPGMCPVAEEACRQVLSLPVCPELSAAQLDYVCRTILDFAGS